MPSPNEAILYFLEQADDDLTTAIQKLTSARANPLITRYFTLLEAAVAYVQYHFNLQVARMDTVTILDFIKSILPAFDENGLSVIDIFYVYFLLVKYCDPGYEVACLVELVLGVPFASDGEREAAQPYLNMMAPAVRLRLIDELTSTYPSFDSATAQEMTLQEIWEGVPFIYNREAARDHAISLSSNNFENFPQNHADVDGVVGKIEIAGERDYSASLDHRPTGEGGTGSAIFISECIFAGNIPMTIRPNTDQNAPECSTDDLTVYAGGFQANGWRVCPNQQTATNTWKNHLGIFSYFSVPPTGLGGEGIGSIVRDDIVDVIYQTPDDPSFDAGNLKEGQPGYEDARDALIEKLNTAPLSTLKAGDYIYIDVIGGDNHGFFVVGWGPLLGTLTGIDYALNNTLSIERASPITDHVIPYVADFCFGTKDEAEPNSRDSADANDRTGWLQDPRARPFYSTRVIITGESNLRPDQVNFLRKVHYPEPTSELVIAYQEFATLQWNFYRIPSVAEIPYMRLFRA